MISQVFKKELSEKKTLILLGIILCVVPVLLIWFSRGTGMVHGKYADQLAVSLAWVFFLIFSCIYPVLLAASSISGEVENNTMNFLLSLPIPRWKIWGYKVFASSVIVYSLIAVYFFLNRSLFTGLFDVTEFSNIFAWWSIVLLLLPLVALSLTFLFSALFSNEMTVTLASIVAVVFLNIILGIIIALSGWEVLPEDVIFILGTIVLIFLVTSLVVFIKGEQFKNPARKLRFAAVCIIIGFLFGIGVNFARFASIHRLSENDAVAYYPYKLMGQKKDMLLTTVLFRDPRMKKYGLETFPSGDRRLWLTSLKDNSRKELPIRFIGNIDDPEISPDKTRVLVFKETRYSNYTIMAKYYRRQLWLYDYISGKVRWITDLPLKGHCEIFWLDNNRFGVVLFREDSNREIAFFDTSGNELRKVKIPEAPDKKPSNVSFQVVRGEIYINYNFGWFGRWAGNQNRPGYDASFIRKYNFEKNEFETVAEFSVSSGDEGVSLMWRPLSFDGKSALYIRKNRKTDSTLFVRRMSDHRELDIAELVSSVSKEDLSSFSGWTEWIEHGQLLKCEFIKKGKSAEKEPIFVSFIIDAETGKVKYWRENCRITSLEIDDTGKNIAFTDAESRPGKPDEIYFNIVDLDKETLMVKKLLHEKPFRLDWDTYTICWLDDSSVLLKDGTKLVKYNKNNTMTVLMDYSRKSPDIKPCY